MPLPDIEEVKAIRGVQLTSLTPHGDDRGRFIETFRKTWFPQRDWDRVQMNVSYSKAGAIRGLHYHLQQVDYWMLIQGEIRVGLYDLRKSSPTSGTAHTIDLRFEDFRGLFIPVGVAHGFSAKTDMILSYLVDDYYDKTDEHGVAWDDPDIGIDWDVDITAKSERDTTNPRLREIPPEALPD